ncbi:MFS transporter [Mesorhizobium sp. ZMM04-5]|uniref:MFS transporter n=1 Tax=Mesorhizobium marinum TaxID=3228790 RepID=A0ABV3QY21_9HYPH
MSTDTLAAAAVRGRWAIAAIFFVNGFVTGSWAPQIPVFLHRLEITETTLGLLILLFGAGAVSAMVWAGHLIPRYGSRAVTSLFAISCCFGLLLVALAPNVWTAAIAMYVFGGTIGATDVSMNANAVTVEKKLGRAIMSSSHGFWSLGGFVGGGLGGIAIQAWGHLAHAAIVSVVATVIVAAAIGKIVTDLPVADEHRKFVLPRTPGVYIIGLMALLCMNSEGAVLDWGALYLRQELGTDIATAGFAFGAFAGAMALMRFLGDGVRNRFGAVAAFRTSALVAAAGMLVAGLAPWPWLVIAAFAVSGLGIANMVPILFSAAGNQAGTSPGAGMSVVTTMGYSGILLAPSVIGFVGERTGFAPIFVAISGLMLAVMLASGMTGTADQPARGAAPLQPS